jgi:segregation and condensation protein A
MLENLDNYRVQLEVFEGPLDLLFFLIRKNEVDIYDIPVNLIVDQYQQYLDLMQTLNLEIAGEFLVMAATLSHIKSRMLLPKDENAEEEEEDPRQELIDKLLEYKRYKEAAGALVGLAQLGREVFVREFDEEGLKKVASEVKAEKLEFEEVDLFKLLDAFQELISKRNLDDIRRVVVQRVSVVDKITHILERLRDSESIEFDQLIGEKLNRMEVVITFLALLELIRLQVIKAYQAANFGAIQIKRAVPLDDDKLKPGFLTSKVAYKEANGGTGENPINN